MGKALPPRKINVHKYAESRALELETLHSIVANRLDNDYRSRRTKRRRTTAFDNQITKKGGRRKKRKLGLVDNSDAELGSEKEQKKKVPRHIRRRHELKLNPESGFCTSGDGTKRLRTHVWHAKRFSMTKLWGFHLPQGLQGRGRGSRALLKRFRQGVLVHDASYYSAVQLEGPEDSLLSVLKMVLVPSPLALPENISHSLLSGVTYQSAMLYRIGAPVSLSISPVTYMWQPVSQKFMYNVDETNKPNNMECCASVRQLWVWIHASAFNEGYDAIKLACQKEMHERGNLINCLSLEGQLGKLELMGSGTFELLQKILYPITCISNNCWQLRKHSAAEGDFDSLHNGSLLLKVDENISSYGISSLTVKDPRNLPKTRTAAIMGSASTNALDDEPETENKEFSEVGILDKDKDLLSSSKLGENSSLFDNCDLWEIRKGVSPPVEERILCAEKQEQRMEYFCLDNLNSGRTNTSMNVQCSRFCPILLLQNNNQKGLLIGWSILLPLSWMRAFWIPLISNGGHAIGLREKCWIACEMGLPLFPSGFPDCHAYTCFTESKAAESNQKAELRPPAIRPLRVPTPPPWASVRVALDNELTTMGTTRVSSEEGATNDNSVSNSGCRRFGISSYGHDGKFFDGFVARTGGMLTDFQKEIQAGELLLFPQVADRKMSISKFIKDKRKIVLDRNGISYNSCDRKLCFLRVQLNACKEGFFEEGSVICAPRPTDISSFRLDAIEEVLQMSQASVGLYFKEQSSSNWEFQIPEDPLAREFHRSPIGLVTSGFVQGSKKLVAEGFCEAVLLSHLREDQWNEIPANRRREIYVLVRNLRSTAYRLALASIVLERQEHDLDFM
ncbi:Ribonucleases P/MRP protein subunit POP1 [Quillaja saponaria]|uniref:Ribonucleases P/MRP protein subunit POP1 n=1 Tax=Quillaja saponaria TaxID=32244 RepID=A0AAD7QJN2_QUISA|nr:Ribonucleases P/MRP protein subunit POP1 [Quillaja saponaria]KAJ7982506.1 Ribonucleases P/MRP protein subunit POP1 [Quillaja saponaria]